jgi:hypothetical protein
MEALTTQFPVVYLRRGSVLSSAPKSFQTYLAYNMIEDGYYAGFQVHEDTFIHIKLHLDQREQGLYEGFFEPSQRLLTGILVGKQGNKPSDGFVTVVRQIDRYYERIGLPCFGGYHSETLVYSTTRMSGRHTTLTDLKNSGKNCQKHLKWSD